MSLLGSTTSSFNATNASNLTNIINEVDSFNPKSFINNLGITNITNLNNITGNALPKSLPSFREFIREQKKRNNQTNRHEEKYNNIPRNRRNLKHKITQLSTQPPVTLSETSSTNLANKGMVTTALDNTTKLLNKIKVFNTEENTIPTNGADSNETHLRDLIDSNDIKINQLPKGIRSKKLHRILRKTNQINTLQSQKNDKTNSQKEKSAVNLSETSSGNLSKKEERLDLNLEKTVKLWDTNPTKNKKATEELIEYKNDLLKVFERKDLPSFFSTLNKINTISPKVAHKEFLEFLKLFSKEQLQSPELVNYVANIKDISFQSSVLDKIIKSKSLVPRQISPEEEGTDSSDKTAYENFAAGILKQIVIKENQNLLETQGDLDTSESVKKIFEWLSGILTVFLGGTIFFAQKSVRYHLFNLFRRKASNPNTTTSTNNQQTEVPLMTTRTTGN